ncbi:factor-independent urate hydroxylase [Kitasatospora purpeofusca]|uniref:factor-independent urate hydroxylase n=1 Tax=Kitasatospora purpeofusca TaxID=67352 RepID=UPI002A5AB590|nr:urate oxidase [Kitasatospora purpeofusca]MDY0811077.1 urate oxidase [Kitasatospora purpeofusca]
MRIVLGQNQYGKEQVRVVRVQRGPESHRIKDLSVSISLSGDLDDTHLGRDNSKVLVTDTQKNTVYAFAKEHGINEIEDFGILLARHFVDSHPPIHRSRVRIEEYSWNAALPPESLDAESAPPAQHAFTRSGSETRTAEVVYDGTQFSVTCGLTGLHAFKTSGSQFQGFAQDRYTTLLDTADRVMTPAITARWRHRTTTDDGPSDGWTRAHHRTRTHMLQAFADTYSFSQQQTLYAMGTRMLEHRGELDEVRLSLRNMHHLAVDLNPFDLDNDNEVFYAPDRPYGIMEGTVLREGATARIPTD